MDDRLRLSKDNVADALLEDDIFYRNDTPGSVKEIAVVSLLHNFFRTPALLGKAIICWNHLRKRMDLFAFGSKHWIGRVCLLSFYAVGLCEFLSSTSGHFKRLSSGRP
jgi:hypothetical protein